MHTHTPYSHTSTLSHVLTTRINNHSATHTQLHTHTHSYRTQSLTAHIAIYIHTTQIYHTQPSHTQLPTWLHNLTPYTQLYSHHTQSHIHNHTHTHTGPSTGPSYANINKCRLSCTDSFTVLQPRTRNEGKKKAHLTGGECGVPLGLEEILTFHKAEWVVKILYRVT